MSGDGLCCEDGGFASMRYPKAEVILIEYSRAQVPDIPHDPPHTKH